MNKKVKKYFWQLNAAVIILVSLLAISSNLTGRSFTSDDVAQQAITYNLTQPGPHHAVTGDDTFVSKLPIYYLFNVLTHPGRTQLLLESLLFNGAMVILLAVWWSNIAPKKRSSWLVFVWLLAAGIYWMSQTVNPNTRNVDIALMLLFSLWAIRRIEAWAAESKNALRDAVCGGIIAGLIMYDDPYFLYFVGLPLCLAILVRAYARKTYRSLEAAGVALTVSLFVYKSLGIVFAHFGLAVGRLNETSALAATIIRPDYLPGKTLQALNGYLVLLGASPSVHLTAWSVIGAVLNFGVICLALSSVYYFIRKRMFTLLNLWILITIVVSLLYVIVTGTRIIYTFHYLLILVPITAFLVLLALQRLASGQRRYYLLATTLLSASLVFNVLQAGALIYRRSHEAARPNATTYKIISALNGNGITDSYGNYWIANTSYYLSGYKDNVLPTLCKHGKIYKAPVLLDAQRFKTVSTKTAILVTPNLVIPTQGLFLKSSSCTIDTTSKQFGKPQKIVHITPSIDLLIYNHNLSMPLWSVGPL